MDEVSVCWTMTGDYDSLLHVMVPSVDDLNGFRHEPADTAAGVREIHAQLVLRSIKGPSHVPLEHLRP